jgi:hypothetical protein
MTEQADLFDRAAKCERLMDVALDPDQKEALKLFRDMWIALANQSGTMTADDMTKKIADLEKLQLGLRQ